VTFEQRAPICAAGEVPTSRVDLRVSRLESVAFYHSNTNSYISYVRRVVTGIVIAASCSVASAIAGAADAPAVRSEKHEFRIVTLVEGLGHPWCLAFLPDGRILLTERPGRLRIIEKNFKLDPTPILGVPRVIEGGQAGLFDVALHPKFAENHWIYLAYNGGGESGSGVELMRAKFGNGRLTHQQTIFRARPKGHRLLNLGGRIIFDGSGYLYLSLGDRFDQDSAQRLGEDLGKVIRLHDDGRVPEDNPFVQRSGARPEIYALGNRNIQGFALHPRTGAVWSHEHGPQGGDEINVIQAGRNYGWPVITYGVNYGTGTKIGEGTHKPGMEQPLYKWVPSIAPSGMAFYDGDKFPRWRDNLLIGALKYQMLVRLELDGERVTKEEMLIEGRLGRIRDVRVGPD